MVKAHSLREAAATLAVAVSLVAVVGAVGQIPGNADQAHASTTHGPDHAATRSREGIAFRNEMRKLWEDHIVWTRMFIVSALADLPDEDTVVGRLLANQDDIGDAIKPYYGEEAGEQLSLLLRDHILIAAELVEAAKNGDSAAFEEANARWHENANEIADFLAAANPKNWSQTEMREMMADHLEWTLAEADARLNADWAGDVAAYDHVHIDILEMADMLSIGIIKQFPSKF